VAGKQPMPHLGYYLVFPAGFASPPALNNGSAFFPNLRGEFNVHQRKEELLLNNRID
jgi:hypothetical protein